MDGVGVIDVVIFTNSLHSESPTTSSSDSDGVGFILGRADDFVLSDFEDFVVAFISINEDTNRAIVATSAISVNDFKIVEFICGEGDW